ncbi:MAG: hypothetical protein KBT31_06820, partial [Firmicutes bacterium]|nr:hypothetical protein [Candidatus Colimorpha enterica]
HVLNAPIDSSNYTYSSETIPFFGIVYHSYLNFAGKATNMAGDIRYEKLKMLENGSNPYFILVYDNSEKLKEDETLSSYYSISYENWKEDLIAAYKQLNSALSLVTDSAIEDHEFVIGERVPSADEKERNDAEDAAAEQAKIEEEEKAKAEEERIAKLQKHLAELMGEDYEDETSETETETEVVTDDSDDTADSEGETSETEEEVSREHFDVDTKDKDYEYTRYTSDNGMIVKVSYDNGYAFILNYNMFDVTVKETGDEVIAAFGFIVVDSNGHVILNSAEEVAE